MSEQAFVFLLALLDDLGLPTSSKKVEAPCRVLTCLGIEFDMDKHIIRIPPAKLSEMIELCHQWAHKTSATKKQIQSLIGKLVHIGKCVRPERLFINRMLKGLRQALDSGQLILSSNFKKDINWFVTSFSTFNGIVMFPNSRTPEHVIFVDSSPCALGVL